MFKNISFWKKVSNVSVVISLIIIIALKFLSDEQKDKLYPFYMILGILAVACLFTAEIMKIVLKKKAK